MYEYPKGFIFATLDHNNHWIRLAGQMPWDLIQEIYAAKFTVVSGILAYTSRLAFGALFLKETLAVSDSELVEQRR